MLLCGKSESVTVCTAMFVLLVPVIGLNTVTVTLTVTPTGCRHPLHLYTGININIQHLPAETCGRKFAAEAGLGIERNTKPPGTLC